MHHPGQTFHVSNIAGYVNAAHLKAATPANTVAAFHTTEFSLMIETYLQKQIFSLAFLLTNLVKCYKNKNQWQKMKVRNRSL
jgi:hypothetical protein